MDLTPKIKRFYHSYEQPYRIITHDDAYIDDGFIMMFNISDSNYESPFDNSMKINSG